MIVQLRRVGDVIFTLPVIGVLRKHFPGAQIDFLVERPADQLVRLNPHVNETLVYDKGEAFSWLRRVRARRYDWVVDFLANGRTLVLTACSGAPVRAGFAGPFTRRLAYNRLVEPRFDRYIVEQKLRLLKGLGVPVEGWSWDLEVPEPERRWAQAFLKEAGVGDRSSRIIGFAPAHRRVSRRWIPERFAEVMRALKRDGATVLLLWGPGERDLMESLAGQAECPGGKGATLIPPQTTLLQLAALIARCSLVVGVDNGPKNMAVGLGIPTVTIMGPTSPTSFNPHDDPAHLVLRDAELSCIGCGLNECPTHRECMEHVTAQMVIDAIRSVHALV